MTGEQAFKRFGHTPFTVTYYSYEYSVTMLNDMACVVGMVGCDGMVYNLVTSQDMICFGTDITDWFESPTQQSYAYMVDLSKWEDKGKASQKMACICDFHDVIMRTGCVCNGI